jgi:hypothetical protein
LRPPPSIPSVEAWTFTLELAMAGKQKKLREGYGGTSEQRQRNLEGDGFEERAPHTPEESEEVRGSPDKGGRVVHVDTQPERLDLDELYGDRE